MKRLVYIFVSISFFLGNIGGTIGAIVVASVLPSVLSSSAVWAQKKTVTTEKNNIEERNSQQEKENSDSATTPSDKKADTEAKTPASVESNFDLLRKELDSQGAQQNKADAEETSWAWQIVKTMFSLAFLLFIFWIIYRIVIFRRKLPKAQSSIIKPLHQVPLQPGKNLHLVEFNSKLLLLGVADSGITLLNEVKEAPLIDQIKLELDQQEAKTDFLLELTNAIKDKVFPQKKDLGKKNSGPTKNQVKNQTQNQNAFRQSLFSAGKENPTQARYQDDTPDDDHFDDWEKMRDLAKNKLGNLKKSKADFRQELRKEPFDDDLFK